MKLVYEELRTLKISRVLSIKVELNGGRCFVLGTIRA